MASITQRGDMQWQAKIRRKGFEPVSRTFSNKRDAEDWAKVVEAEMIRGAYIARGAAEKALLGDLIDRYLREVTPAKKNAKSEGEILARVKSKFGDLALAALQSSDVAKWRDELLATGKAASTVKHYQNALSCVVGRAMSEWGYALPSNPVRNVTPPPQPKGRDRRLLPGELDKILEECRRYRNSVLEPIVRLALETAMRQGELFALNWENIDLNKSIARLLDTKNGEARTVPLSPTAVAILRARLPETNGAKLTALPRGLVFPANVAATRIAFMRAVERARAQYIKGCIESKIEPDPRYFSDLTFHDLRHEAASRLFEKGLDGFEVASITGHKTLAMLKRYTHLRAEDLAKKLA